MISIRATADYRIGLGMQLLHAWCFGDLNTVEIPFFRAGQQVQGGQLALLGPTLITESRYYKVYIDERCMK